MADNSTGLVFVIDGVDYEAQPLSSFNMRERRVMFDLCGLVEEDFLRGEDETDDDHKERVHRLTRHPGFMEAMMTVAYWREHPTMTIEKVRSLVETTNYKEAISKWASADDADDPTQAPTSAPEGSSPKSTSSSSSRSGTDSVSDSVERDKIPADTGASPSETSPTSLRAVTGSGG